MINDALNDFTQIHSVLGFGRGTRKPTYVMQLCAKGYVNSNK